MPLLRAPTDDAAAAVPAARRCRATGEPQQLYRAEQFALFAAQHWQTLLLEPDRPMSLYEGLAGAIALWLDVVLEPQTAVWLGAEL